MHMTQGSSSGVSESVISEEMAKQSPTQLSAGSQQELFTAANGTTTVNQGEKEATFRAHLQTPQRVHSTRGGRTSHATLPRLQRLP